MSWSNAYVGIPYANMGRSALGCDCWGLARLVYDAELNITLPAYTEGYASSEEQAEIASLIGQETSTSVWDRVEDPAAFDVLLFRHGRFESHVGIYVHQGVMLHMATDDQSKHERFDQGRWKARLAGYFRHSNVRLKGAL
tara:strand:- start:3685 stop:4104 length:420 start_codon:yes stop_codon:yes gene_type:complete